MLSVQYLADNRYLPYGDKPPHWLEARAITLTEHLLAQGASLILVACNTATTHTIAALRRRWPAIPFVGVEPGIKPAVAMSESRRIAILATSATLASPRMSDLIVAHAGDAAIVRQPCPGLADAIERGDDVTIRRLLDRTCAELRHAAVDVVVLGCTHYPLVADEIAARLEPGVRLIDTADAVSRRVQALLPAPLAHPSTVPGNLMMAATGDPTVLTLAARRWIDHSLTARLLELPAMADQA
jgi:glutamate racemase